MFTGKRLNVQICKNTSTVSTCLSVKMLKVGSAQEDCFEVRSW